MYLFFDTETTGLPIKFGESATNVDNWPRMVQLAFQHYDKFGNKLSEHCYIIKPEGYQISDEVAKIHRVTQERAEKEGVPLAYALEMFFLTMKMSKHLIAHNINFDKKIIGAEYCRIGAEQSYQEVRDIDKICTMMSTTKIVQAKSHAGGNKWPKLQELHAHLFGENFEDAHDALVDVNAMVKCFFELQDKHGLYK